MWRIGLGILVAAGLALGVMYVLALWPFAPQNEAQAKPTNPSPATIDWSEVPTETPAPPKRVIFGPAGVRILEDPITVSDSTINLMEEQDVSIKVESGQISNIPVRQGQKVAAGQVLIELDDSVARRTEEVYSYKAQSTAKIRAAMATYNTAELLAGQTRRLKDAASEKDRLIDELNAKRSLSDWITANEDREVAQREWRRAQQELENHIVLSKISGEITQINKHPGESVRQSEVLMHIVNFDRLQVAGAPRVESRAALQVGMRATVEPEVETGKSKELRGHTGTVRGLAVTPDSRFLGSAGEDGNVIIWNLQTGRPVQILHDESEATAVACGPITEDPQSQRRTYSFLAGRNDGRAQLWQMNLAADGLVSVEGPAELTGGHRSAIRSVAFSANGDRCATGGEDRQICLWQVADRKLLYCVTGAKDSKGGTAHRGTVTSLHFTPDGYLVSASSDKTLKKWRLGETAADLLPPMRGRVGDVEQLDITADGKRALFDDGDVLWVLDLDTLERLAKVQSQRGQFERLALLAPSGRTILTKTANGRLQLLSTPASDDAAAFLRSASTRGFHRNSLLSLAALTANLTPSGHMLFPAIAATGADQPTKPHPPELSPFILPALVTPATMFPLWTVAPNDFRGMALVPVLWTLTGSEIRHFTLPDASTITCGAFTPDETLAFTAGTDKVIRVWAMPTQAELSQPLEAMVTFVAGQVESGTNMVRIRAEFENPSETTRRLMPGSRVNLTLYPESAARK